MAKKTKKKARKKCIKRQIDIQNTLAITGVDLPQTGEANLYTLSTSSWKYLTFKVDNFQISFTCSKA